MMDRITNSNWLAFLIVTMLGIAGCVQENAKPPTTPKPPTGIAKKEKLSRPPIAREEFEAMVLGKTPQSVIDVLGVPNRTNRLQGEISTFTYQNLTVDLITNRIDSYTVLYFRNGVVDFFTY